MDERGEEAEMATILFNWICLDLERRPMKQLTQYGWMAERHWRQFCPKMVQQLTAQGRLLEALMEAEEQTQAQLDQLRRHLIQTGLTAQQAHDRAWEIVRQRYIFLPPES